MLLEAIGVAICAIVAIVAIVVPKSALSCVVGISTVGIVLSIAIHASGSRVGGWWEEGIAVCEIVGVRAILLRALIIIYQDL